MSNYLYLNSPSVVYTMSLDLSTLPAFISREQTGDLAILSFNISNSYEMPVELVRSQISQFQIALSFAAKLIERENSLINEFTRDSMFSEYLKDITKAHSQEVLNAEKKSLSELAPLLQKISEIERAAAEQISELRRDYEQQIKGLQKANKAAESESATIRAELEATLQKDLKMQKKRIVELESDVTRLTRAESSVRDQCKAESDRLIATIEEKNAKILHVKEEALAAREQKVILKEKDLETKAKRQTSSSLRGQDGEHFFASITKEKMNWTLTKAPTHSCDYSSTILGSLVFFEVKNYTTVIPQKEVVKFLSDMKSHPEALVGIFISLNTGIAGKTVPITIDWINRSQCVVYIQSCADLDIDHVLSFIEQIIRIVGIFNSSLTVTESEEPIFQQRIDQAKVFLEKMVTRLTKLITKLGVDKKQHLALIEANAQNTISELKYQITDLSTTINLMMGTQESVSDNIAEEEKSEAPLKKSPRKK